jgi:hypothetical protein
MESRKAESDQKRESGVVDDRPTKRIRVEDEDGSDEEDERAPQVASQASDLYLDTVRLSRFVTSMRVLIRFYR